MQTAKLVFPHQLFQFNPLFTVSGTFYLIEETLFFRQYNFHKQKIAYHRATMKFYERYLLSKGCDVKYVPSSEEGGDCRVLITNLHQSGVKAIAIVDPVDNWLLRHVTNGCKNLGIGLIVLESPMFLNTVAEINDYFKAKKNKFFQTDFYKQQRITRKLLIDNSGEPIGGRWSFDEDNRKRYPKNHPVAVVKFPDAEQCSIEAVMYTEQHFSGNIGTFVEGVIYPVGYAASEQWLDQFLSTRMPEFGDYEDAIVYKEMLLNHSLLTPMLNVGMLTPEKVIRQTLAFNTTSPIPINSLEGFTRQIIGWREFIRGIYVSKGGQQRTLNYWGFTRTIPSGFYNGTTGILPVDETIRKVLKTGYCHHIERLMVLGNFMLLCEINPDEVYRWFMELFIDAYDWVMVPNVYGMSQFADGGIMSTKPYISGSNYLRKMGDYPKGKWEQTWDALFWRFLDIHRTFFLKNPRLSMLVRSYDKWDARKKSDIHQQAAAYLESL